MSKRVVDYGRQPWHGRSTRKLCKTSQCRPLTYADLPDEACLCQRRAEVCEELVAASAGATLRERAGRPPGNDRYALESLLAAQRPAHHRSTPQVYRPAVWQAFPAFCQCMRMFDGVVRYAPNCRR